MEQTVEDPSETFEDMRDKCDLYTLLSGGDLESLKTAPIDRNFTETIRKKYKLADVRLPSSSLPSLLVLRRSAMYSDNSTVSSK